MALNAVKRSISYDLSASLVLAVTVISVIVIGLNSYFTFNRAGRQYLDKTQEHLAYLQQTLADPLWNMDGRIVHAKRNHCRHSGI